MRRKYPFMIIDWNLNTVLVEDTKLLNSFCRFEIEDVIKHKNRKELNRDIIKFLNDEFDKEDAE